MTQCDAANFMEVLGDLSDSRGLQEALRQSTGQLGREFSAPLVASCDYLAEESVILGRNYAQGELLEIPTSGGVTSTVRTGELDPQIWRRMAITRPAILSRTFMERHAYPDPGAVEWFAQFDYCGWVEIPFAGPGGALGKLSLMQSRRVDAMRVGDILLSESFRALQALWLVARGVERLLGAMLSGASRRSGSDPVAEIAKPLAGLASVAEVAGSALPGRERRALEHLDRLRRGAAAMLAGRASHHPTPPANVAARAREEPASTIRVLLVDEHHLMMEGLSTFLERTPDMIVAGRAATPEEALQILFRTAPDVVVMDVRMTGTDGLGMIRRLGALRPQAHIVVFTSAAQAELIAHCTEAGARGFVLKGADPGEILDAIRRLHKGGTYFGAGVMEKIGTVLRGPRLSPCEITVLPLVAAGMGNKEIAGRLGVSAETVKDRLRTLFKKLDVHSRMELIARTTAMGLLQRLSGLTALGASFS